VEDDAGPKVAMYRDSFVGCEDVGSGFSA